jgi:hypothetical protein
MADTETTRDRLGEGVEATDQGRPAAGETQGQGERFSADQVAEAFGVAVERVHNAMRGEFDLGPDAAVDSRQAQQLAEVLIGDQPQAEVMAATMRLGAFTQRVDDDWGLGDKAPGEESFRLSDRTGTIEGEGVSPRASHDPSTNPSDADRD